MELGAQFVHPRNFKRPLQRRPLISYSMNKLSGEKGISLYTVLFTSTNCFSEMGRMQI